MHACQIGNYTIVPSNFDLIRLAVNDSKCQKHPTISREWQGLIGNDEGLMTNVEKNQAQMSNEKWHIILICHLALDLCHSFVI
jgi:hypothetical protein